MARADVMGCGWAGRGRDVFVLCNKPNQPALRAGDRGQDTKSETSPLSRRASWRARGASPATTTGRVPSDLSLLARVEAQRSRPSGQNAKRTIRRVKHCQEKLAPPSNGMRAEDSLLIPGHFSAQLGGRREKPRSLIMSTATRAIPASVHVFSLVGARLTISCKTRHQRHRTA